MPLSIERIETLLLVAAITAMLARRLGLPYTVGLVLAGLAIAFSPLHLAIPLTRRLLFGALLPPLIFEAALNIPWRGVRADWPVMTVLATVGVLLSAVVVAGGMHLLAGWAWVSAWAFGALIAATDPVSVIAALKEAGARGRFRLLAETESLLNDGTAAVLFALVLAGAAGRAAGPGGIAVSFLATTLGGVLAGALLAAVTLLLAGRTTDRLVEITFTTVAAYGSFMLAEHFGVSGVFATLTAGLLVGNLGPLGAISERGREAVESFWEYVAFAANSIVFILIGMTEARVRLGVLLPTALLAVLLVLVARAVAVYGGCGFFAGSAYRVLARHQHLLWWGGLRGALALALALALPAGFPLHPQIVTVTFTVVAFSVIIQGLTIIPLLRRLGELPPPPPRRASSPQHADA